MSTSEQQIARILDILTNDNDSPISKFIHEPPPDNDMGYLQIWFDYITYTYLERDYFQELSTDGWLSYTDATINFEVRLRIWQKIRSLFDSALKNKLDNLSFKPRLEKYIDTYPADDQDNIRRLIIGYLLILQDKFSHEGLIELGEKIKLSKEFLYSLNERHRLFKEKIIELEDSVIGEGRTFLHKDMVPNSAIFKIFAGLDVSEKELIMLKESPLLNMFNLREDTYADEIVHNKEQNDENSNGGYGNSEDTHDIESLLKKIEETGRIDQEEESNTFVPDSPDNEDILTPYHDDLEYLHNEYLWIRTLIKLKEIKHSDFSIDRDEQRKISILEQEWKGQKRICEIRLRKSLENNFRPRLEILGDMLKLNEQERNLIKILITSRLFLTEKRYLGEPTVGDVLTVLYDSAIDRVKAKNMFLKNAKLVRSSIIQLESKGIDKNLFECIVIIDNRLVEYLIGEDYDITNYIEGSVLYKPSTTLDAVIIPREHKDALLRIVNHFPSFLKAKSDLGISSVVEYGNSLVMLFVGPSGTGKTMLANALANYLDKRILVFNLNNLSGISNYSYKNDNLFSLLFRESRMNDAILFFDEAEEILRSRINDLLMEIEKHQGIVIFATNASFKIDEAMRRRINHILHFQEPGPALRKDIWKIHLPKAVQLADDVDPDKLAQRYEINGGLIKNAVFASLAKAVSENNSDKPVLTLDHLMEGAKEQLKNKLFMSKLQEHKIPQKGLDSVILPESTLAIIHELVNIEKARKVLAGEWGFKEVFPDHNGVAVLFHGPPGTGKTYTAEALAYETGKNLKIVNYAQVISMWVGGTEKALEALFNEVADTDSILLFDEADAIFAARTGIATANDRFVNVETDVLLGLIERFNSIAILTTNYIDNIDQAFFRRMQYIIEFKEPDEELRLKLWQTLCPPKLPISEDVNMQKLAADYQFTGGDIKNAIIRAATKRAVRLDQNRQVTMADLETACREIEQHKRNGSKRIGF